MFGRTGRRQQEQEELLHLLVVQLTVWAPLDQLLQQKFGHTMLFLDNLLFHRYELL